MQQTPSLPPGPPESPLRQLVRSARDPVRFMDECRARYGKVYTTRIPWMPPIVNFAVADAVRDVFANAGDTMCAGEATKPVEFLVGRFSLLRLDGARHKRERKLMMPAVHGERMSGYGAEMRAITDDVVSRLRPGDEVRLQDMMQEITLRVILKSVFGITDPKSRVHELVTEFLRLAMMPDVTIVSVLASGHRLRRFLGQHLAPMTDRAARFGVRLPWSPVARCIRELDETLHREIQERRKVAEGRSDVMSMLARATDEDGRGLSDDELRDEMMTLLVAGHETTATTLGWAVALCLEHREIGDRVRSEYDAVFGAGSFDPSRIQELKYTDAVVKETLRLYPVAPAVARRLKRPMTIAGYTLPEGVLVSPSVYHLHRDPDVWPDPLTEGDRKWHYQSRCRGRREIPFSVDAQMRIRVKPCQL
jgi:cytochrome P450